MTETQVFGRSVSLQWRETLKRNASWKRNASGPIAKKELVQPSSRLPQWLSTKLSIYATGAIPLSLHCCAVPVASTSYSMWIPRFVRWKLWSTRRGHTGFRNLASCLRIFHTISLPAEPMFRNLLSQNELSSLNRRYQYDLIRSTPEWRRDVVNIQRRSLCWRSSGDSGVLVLRTWRGPRRGKPLFFSKCFT